MPRRWTIFDGERPRPARMRISPTSLLMSYQRGCGGIRRRLPEWDAEARQRIINLLDEAEKERNLKLVA